MARQRKPIAPRKTSLQWIRKWTGLTLGDVEDWAGKITVERGMEYSRTGRVHDLLITEDGRLLATVVGEKEYFAAVWMSASRASTARLLSECTCPAGQACKHAVAVLSEFLRRVSAGEEIATFDGNADEKAANEPHVIPIRPSIRGRRTSPDQLVLRKLDTQTADQLRDLIRTLVEQFPQVRQEIRRRLQGP